VPANAFLVSIPGLHERMDRDDTDSSALGRNKVHDPCDQSFVANVGAARETPRARTVTGDLLVQRHDLCHRVRPTPINRL